MKNFVIVTDTTSDLPRDYVEKHSLGMLDLTYTLEGVTYGWDNPMPVKEFYDTMRNGSLPTTSQANPESVYETFKKIITEQNADILCIAFSSALSGTYNSCQIAKEMTLEEFPEAKIIVIDSLCASLGEGLFVHKAVCLKESGHSLDETVKWLEDNKLHFVHNFTVDNLFHLHRGGRVSATAAVVGTVINLKPVLHVDNEGKLIPVHNVRGRKKSLIDLVDAMGNQMGAFKDQNDIVFIGHGDCEEDANFVANLVKERYGITNFLINNIGPTIGAHTGAGVMTLFYMGEYR